MNSRIHSQIEVPSGPQRNRPERQFEIQAKDFAQVEQGNPVPVAFGNPAPFSGFQITPIFGFRAKAIKEKIGKKKTTVGYTYFGSFATLVGIGPIKTLLGIYNGDTLIYEGPTQSSSADGDGKTVLTTEIGTIRFYWGTSSQNADSLLSALLISVGGASPTTVPIPPWRGLAYIVADDVAFGEQTVGPTLRFDVLYETSGLTLGAHSTNNDGLIPEIAYQALTDTLFGLGVPAADIDSASFQTAAAQSLSDAFGISPLLDENLEAREFFAKLAWYDDAYLYLDEGQLHYKQIRSESIFGLTTIDEGDLLDEPLPSNEGFADTWNMTFLEFTDRDTKWEEAVEPYEDPANLAIVGRRVHKNISAPWVTRRPVSKIMAKRLGEKGGLPTMGYSLRLLPEHKTFRVGDRFFLTYAKLGISNRLMRIAEITLPSRSDPAVQLEVVEEYTRDTTNDFVVPADEFDIPQESDADGNDPFDPVSPTVRLSFLTDEQKNGAVDGFQVFGNRPHVNIVRMGVYFNWDPTVRSYSRYYGTEVFPAKGELQWWHKTRDDNWLVRIKFPSSFDYDRVLELQEDDGQGIRIAIGRRVIKTLSPASNETRLSVIWLTVVAGGVFEATTADTITLEAAVTSADDSGPVLETTSSAGTIPTLHCYVGLDSDFSFHRGKPNLKFERELGNGPIDPSTGNPVDTDLIRYIKVLVTTGRRANSLSDVTASTLDRDDTTDGPDGTVSVSWGDGVRSGYQNYDESAGSLVVSGIEDAYYSDVEDIDIALNLNYQGIAESDDLLLMDDLDELLGGMVLLGHTHYNVT